MKVKKCVYAGTFDPPTVGHEKVVEESLRVFDEVVIAVMINGGKQPLFTEEERIYLLKKLFGDYKNVRVTAFHGAACDLLKAENTPFYVRGVRDAIDFSYETRDYYATKKLMPEVVEIYFPAAQESMHVSSTLVKNSMRFDKDCSAYLPEKIAEDIYTLMEKKNV